MACLRLSEYHHYAFMQWSNCMSHQLIFEKSALVCISYLCILAPNALHLDCCRTSLAAPMYLLLWKSATCAANNHSFELTLPGAMACYQSMPNAAMVPMNAQSIYDQFWIIAMGQKWFADLSKAWQISIFQISYRLLLSPYSDPSIGSVRSNHWTSKHIVTCAHDQ